MLDFQNAGLIIKHQPLDIAQHNNNLSFFDANLGRRLALGGKFVVQTSRQTSHKLFRRHERFERAINTRINHHDLTISYS